MYTFWSICSTLALSTKGRLFAKDELKLFSEDILVSAIVSDCNELSPLQLEVYLNRFNYISKYMCDVDLKNQTEIK